MEPLKTIDAAKRYIQDSFIKDEEALLISEILNDKMGVNMAMILNLILEKGYLPNGFEQKENYRIYSYKKD